MTPADHDHQPSRGLVEDVVADESAQFRAPCDEATLDNDRFRDRPAEAQGRRGGRPPTVDDNVLAVAHARQARGESVTAIARHRKIGRSTLYRALQLREGDLASAAVEPAR